ncbi:CotH kinase family protein [Luedemannella helvata]|uniref:CBM2 domain-containing protein n=1 Tax=Luedemannella helvata TaxID=349315 RepID=A0ABN2L3B9_9ACTN
MRRSLLKTVVPAGLVVVLVAGFATTQAIAADAPQAAPLAAPALANVAADQAGDIVFSTPSGTFTGSVSVSLSTAVAGAQVRYTTDGSLPSASSPVYSSPIQITRTTQVRAQAFVNGAASGTGGSQLYVAQNVSTSHDLPVLILDTYSKGVPGANYVDTALIELPATSGSATLAGAPVLATRAAVHVRGNSSQMYDKKQWRVELRDNTDDDANYPLLGMPADGDWVLRGPFADKSLIRDALMFDLSRAMGRPAPRYRFVELYLNTDAQPVSAADYQGVYVAMETIKNDKNRLDLKSLDEDDLTEPKISGGYLMSFEWQAAEEPTVPCSGANCWQYLELRDPDPVMPEQRTWIANYIKRFSDALHSSSFTDPVTGYAAYIDVNSFVDQVILYELGRDMDAYLRSFYLYKDRDQKMFAGPVWDNDLTFGIGGYFQNNQTSGWQYQQTRTPVANDWVQRLMQDPAFVNLIKQRWSQLRQGILSNAQFEARVNQITAPLTAAAQRNFTRWPNLTTQMIGPFNTPTANTWQGQVQQLKTWAQQRMSWLDSPSGGAWLTTVVPTSAAATTSAPVSTRPPTSAPVSTSPPTSAPVSTRPPTSAPVTSRPPTSGPAGGGGCSAAYTVVNQWQGGFQGEVKVTAGSAAITGWRVTWTYANGQTVTQFWSATITSSGSAVTATNVSYNGALGAGASTTFGFLGSWNGTNTAPSVTCTAL